MSTQFSLPMKIDAVTADRDLDGVRKCILEAVWQAQGKGCGPGFLGVCIGGDRASGYAAAKEQLLRLVDDINPDPVLAELEARILDESNTFMIGPMGFGGSMTIGGCKITKLNRLPASFFVSVAYMCWAFRRRGFVLDSTGNIDHWLYQNDSDNSDISSDSSLDSVLGSAKQISAPLDELTARSLHAGDIVLLTGVLHTGRDEVHKFLHKGGDIASLKGATIYHCGPVIIDKAGERKVIAAGPTTSIREEPYQADVIKNYGVRAVIGKGGMGSKTLAALREHGCVYLHAVGGAAQIYAKCIERVLGVHMLDRFGSPEAVWELQVKDFPVVVTMDSHGVSLHEQVERDSRSNLVKSLM
jgi:fumarate hydratase class I